MILLLILLNFALLISLLGNLAAFKLVKSFPRERERERNVWMQRESELLDRLMHQAGQTWTRPPLPKVEEEPPTEEEIKRQEEGWKEV